MYRKYVKISHCIKSSMIKVEKFTIFCIMCTVCYIIHGQKKAQLYFPFDHNPHRQNSQTNRFSYYLSALHYASIDLLSDRDNLVGFVSTYKLETVEASRFYFALALEHCGPLLAKLPDAYQR